MTGPVVEIYSDGACRGNPGPGGWGAVLRYGDRDRELLGADAHTTNNRMELTAVLRALEALTRSCEVTITTDSKYVMDGVTRWLENWQRNGWRTSGRKPVKNRDLWEALDRELARHRVTWSWVRGHSGHPENERADTLANIAIDRLRAGEDLPAP